jgi:putative hydrolase of the HAD superfamily
VNEPSAIIFDVYGTLFEAHPPEGDPETAWRELHRETFGREADFSLAHLAERCQHIVSDDHDAAHHAGLAWPEVVWESVMARALPAVAERPAENRDDFIFRHIQLLRTVTLAPGAIPILQHARKAGLPLGIVSNAQPYTLRELGEALAAAGLPADLFVSALSLWSFELGFSKPDPHVFRLLAVRLHRLGLRPADTLVVGDRLDNDIEPARAQGFQTWWLNTSSEGDWAALRGARFPGLAGESIF